MTRFVPISLFLLLCHFAAGQSQLGLRTSLYGGASSISHDASAQLFNPHLWDATVFGTGVFFEQNHLFFENTKTPHLYQPGFEGVNGLYITEELPAPAGTTIFNFFEHNQKRQVYLNVYAEGPAFAMRLGKRSFGFSTALRAVASLRNVAKHLAYPEISNFRIGESISAPKLQIGAAAFSELALNYAQIIQESSNFQVSLGGNLKFLQARQGAFFLNKEEGQFRRYGDTIEIDFFDIAYGYVDHSSDPDAGIAEVSGNSLGLDLSISYIKNPQPGGAYKLKLNANLLDLGKLRFQKNAQQFALSSENQIIINSNDYDSFSGLSGYDQQASLDRYGSPGTSEADQNFSMWLPTALFLQADFGLGGGNFFNASAMLRAPLGGPGISRQNQFALSYRFESRWFGLGIPAILYEFQDPRVGANIKLGPLHFGSDHLLSWFLEDDWSGSDIYFALKLNPVLFAKSKKVKGNKASKNDPLSCPKM